MRLHDAWDTALSKVEGLEAYSWIEFSAADKLFYFNVFNVFLGSVFTGTFLSVVRCVP